MLRGIRAPCIWWTVVLGQSSENSSVAAFHASGSIRSSLYSSQQHSPDQFRLRWLRPILTGEFARSLVLFQKGLFGLPVSLSVVPVVLLGMNTFAAERGLDWDSKCPSASKGLIREAAQRGRITNGLKQLKHVPGKLHGPKAKIGTLCGPWHKIQVPIVMRRRLYVTAATLGDRHPRYKKMHSIIFWLGRCVTGWEKTTGVIRLWTEQERGHAPLTSMDLQKANSHWLMPLWESAAWQPQSCDCQRLWRHSRSLLKM